MASASRESHLGFRTHLTRPCGDLESPAGLSPSGRGTNWYQNGVAQTDLEPNWILWQKWVHKWVQVGTIGPKSHLDGLSRHKPHKDRVTKDAANAANHANGVANGTWHKCVG